MLTVQQLKDMPEGTIFSVGEMFDKPGQLNMTNSGKLLRWVAVRGRIHDWAIYCHFAEEHPAEWIRNYGDKVNSKEHIKMCVPCDDEAYEMYRR